MSPASTRKRLPPFLGHSTPLLAEKTSATVVGGTKKGHYKRLPKEFRHNAFTYRQIYREGDFAIYQQTWKGNEYSAAFEVIRVRKRQGFQIGGRFIAAGEVYPKAEAWGTDGFTLQDKESALHKLREIIVSPNALTRFEQQEVER